MSECLVCADRARTRRWFVGYGALLALTMLAAHVLGIRMCYEWIPWACGYA